MEEAKTIYTLKLHESLVIDGGICVLRVAGGWIYDFWDTSSDLPKTGVFIPFHNEYM